jgi:DNA primase
VGGDVFRFLELYENKPFMEVLSELASQVGISLHGSITSEDRERIKEVRTIEDILTETAGFYHQKPHSGGQNLSHQRARLYRGDHFPLSDRLC